MSEIERLVDEFARAQWDVGYYYSMRNSVNYPLMKQRYKDARAALLAALPKGEPVVYKMVSIHDGRPFTQYESNKDDAESMLRINGGTMQPLYAIGPPQLREVAGDE